MFLPFFCNLYIWDLRDILMAQSVPREFPPSHVVLCSPPAVNMTVWCFSISSDVCFQIWPRSKRWPRLLPGPQPAPHAHPNGGALLRCDGGQRHAGGQHTPAGERVSVLDGQPHGDSHSTCDRYKAQPDTLHGQSRSSSPRGLFGGCHAYRWT